MRMLFFDAAWSVPARLMAPMAKRIAREHGWPFLPIEAGEWPELLRHYGIKTLPELVLAHELAAPAGEEVGPQPIVLEPLEHSTLPRRHAPAGR